MTMNMTNRQVSLSGVDRVGELSFTPLEKTYLRALLIETILAYLALMALTPLLLLWEEFSYRIQVTIAAECVWVAALAVNLFLLPKTVAYKGFAIREHDITYRSGILFPKVTTIPFRKIQQVSVRQNPITRLFGLYAVDIVNGAQLLSAISVPGLTARTAEEIKALVTRKTNGNGNGDD